MHIEALSGQEVLSRYRSRSHDLALEAWIPEFADPHFNAAAFARNQDNRADAGSAGSLAWRNGYAPGRLGQLVDEAFAMQDESARNDLFEHRSNAPFVIMFQIVEKSAIQSQVVGYSSDGILRRVNFREVSH